MATVNQPRPTAPDTLYRWRGAKRPDGTQLTFVVEVAHAAAGYSLPTDPQLLTSHASAQYASKLSQYVASGTEPRTINGIDFTRFYWKGVSPKTGKEVHGFAYINGTGDQIVSIEALDSEPYNQTTLALCESSALTLRRL